MRKSMTAGILVMFLGYAVASYGYVLLQGWDVPWRGWIDPLHAYQWPAGGVPGPIPAGQVFPNQGALAVPAQGLASPSLTQAVSNAVTNPPAAPSGG